MSSSNRHKVTERDLRLAVSFSGGVSLAVWMGGVALELERLCRSSPRGDLGDPSLDSRADEIYRCLLDLTATRASIDVIAGTSAGGINGAALAVAISAGKTVEGLRSTWLARGSLTDLLRDPRDPDSSKSLLRGDDKLGAGIYAALIEMTEVGPPPSSWSKKFRERLSLSITSSLMTPIIEQWRDSAGEIMSLASHFGPMAFDQSFWNPTATAAAVLERTKLAKIAEAARASASYPVGFEPARLVGADGDATEEVFPRPNISEHIEWAGSRWALDGGLLRSAPVDLLLDGVVVQPADGPVRRVLLHITPDSPTHVTTSPALGDQPGLTGVIPAIHTIQSNQCLASELRRTEDHNSRVIGRQEARRALLQSNAGFNFLGTEFTVLRAQAARTLSWRFTKSVLQGRAFLTPLEASSGTADLGRLNRIRLEVSRARKNQLLNGITDDGVFATAEVVEQPAAAALSAVRAVQTPGSAAVASREVRANRSRLTEIIREVRSNRRLEVDQWANAAALALTENAELIAPAPLGAFEERLGEVAEIVDRCANVSPGTTGELAELALLAEGGPDVIRRRLFYIPWLATGGFTYSGEMDQALDVVVLSGRAWNGFACRPGDDGKIRLTGIAQDGGAVTEASEKLNGMSLQHFAAFVKRSWRSNDWVWGRLDASYHLCRLLLDGKRLRELGRTADYVVNGLERAVGSAAPKGVADEIGTVLCQPDGGGFPAPASAPMEVTARWLARTVQERILIAELPNVARSVVEDAELGAEPSESASAFVQAVEGASSSGADCVLTCEALAHYDVHAEALVDDSHEAYVGVLKTRASLVALSSIEQMFPSGPTWARPIRWLLSAARVLFRLKARWAQHRVDRIIRRNLQA